MITSIIVALVGYGLLAIVSVLDKYILEKTLSHSSVYAFYSTIFFFAAFLLFPFTDVISKVSLEVSLVSGLAFGFGMWVMFKALKKGETTHVIPFIGAATALSTFGLSYVVFNETFSRTQLWGVLLLIIASALFAYEKRESAKLHRAAYLYGFASGFLFALSHVSAKFVYEHNTFLTGFMWTKALVGVVALIAYCSPLVRAQIHGRKTSEDTLPNNTQEIPTSDESAPKKSFVIIAWDKVLGLGGTVLIQYAIAGGSVTVVNSLVGFQYAATFGLVLLVSAFRPAFLYEYVSRKEYVTEISAIILVVCGTYLLL